MFTILKKFPIDVSFIYAFLGINALKNNRAQQKSFGASVRREGWGKYTNGPNLAKFVHRTCCFP